MGSFLSRFFLLFKEIGDSKKGISSSDLFSDEDYLQLEKLIGTSINNRSYYIQALIHRSFLEKNTRYDFSNERLEYLGDSVLSLAVAEYLFSAFPAKDEGFLTKARSKLVNRIALADVSERIGLKDFLLLSKNLQNTFANGSKTILCDALEALIGAVYLDQGLETARKFVLNTIIPADAADEQFYTDENFKSQLLEYAQANKLEIPTYLVVKEEGPQHERIFTIKVIIGSDEYGSGSGRSKKEAEQNAAEETLRLLHQIK